MDISVGYAMSELHKQASRLGIKPPGASTLRRYGLTADEWLAFLRDQGWKCAVCMRRTPRWATDHEHVPGWAKKPPHERAKYVRGVLCIHCNWKLVHSSIKASTVENIARYLRAYEARRDSK